MSNPYTDWKSPFGKSLYGNALSTPGLTTTPKPKKLSQMDTLGQQVDSALSSYGTKAKGLESEENARGQRMEDAWGVAINRLSQPTITDGDISRRFGQGSDLAADSFLKNASGVTDYVGDSGVTGGGLPAGMAVNAEIARLGQLTKTRGDLTSFKATSDALDRQRELDARSQFAVTAINRPVSMLGADFENQALQTRLSQLGIESNLEGAKAQAKATKDAAGKAQTGGIIGSVLSLAGGLFG